jgi:hypothetical protein
MGGTLMLGVVRSVAIGGLLLLSLTMLAETAFSQTPATQVSGFATILNNLVELVFAVIGAAATYLINSRIKNQELANMLSNSVKNGLGVVQQHVQQRAASAAEAVGRELTPSDPAIQAGVDYVFKHAGEALKNFGIQNREHIAEKLVAKLGLAAIETNLAETASPTPVVAGPLAPVNVASQRQL